MSDAAPALPVAETLVAAPAPPPAAAAPAKPSHRHLTTVAAISFSLTFVGLSLALLLGLLPQKLARLELGIDMGVVLLMVPVCALVLATLLEVLHMALRGLPRLRSPRPAAMLGTPSRPLPPGWPAARRG